jgi:hypothetical protein
MCLSSVLGSSLYATDLFSLRGGPASPITDVLTLTFYYLAIDLIYLLQFLYLASLLCFIALLLASALPARSIVRLSL